MRSTSNPRHIGLFAILLLVSCGDITFDFDPPPEPTLDLPKTGTYSQGESLTLQFTEPVELDTLAIRIWSLNKGDWTKENDFNATLQPTIDTCAARFEDQDSQECDGADLVLKANRLSATLNLTNDIFNEAKRPWKLEVLAGLTDAEGSATGIRYLFDFQYAPAVKNTDNPIAFESGVYHMLAEIKQPLPATLTIFVDMQVKPDGSTRWAGGKVKPIGQEPKNTTDTTKLELDTGNDSFAIFVTGQINDDGEERFFQSEPFDLTITIGPIEIILGDISVAATVQKDVDTGLDRLDGTVYISSVTLDVGGGDPVVYDPVNTSFFAQQVPKEDVPKGLPSVCGDLCGAIPSQCKPSSDFPGDSFCSDN